MIDYLVLSLFIIVALSGLISHVFGFPGNFIILTDGAATLRCCEVNASGL